jgi:hypothetical protein
MGLKEAKDVVDSYDLKNFEDRVVRSFGEEARGELQSWARQFVAKENKPFSYVEANVPDNYYTFRDETPGCTCDECTNYRI